MSRNPPPSAKKRADILVVDDTIASLGLLTEVLKLNGYKVRPVTNGPAALQAARTLPPDLILLDVLMPEMDGYEVCDQLKADPALADIPVLFLTGSSKTEQKVRGLRAGGSDYITKPFQAAEVLARIEVHLELHRERVRLKAQNELLMEKVRPTISAEGSLSTLSSRELEILAWVREGKRNSEIAHILGISAHTVRHHLEKVFAKLGVETRTAAVAMLGEARK